MRNLIITLTIFLSLQFSSKAQGITSPLRLNIEIDILQPVFGGYGGTLGLEKGQFGWGLMAFSSRLSNSSRNFIMKGADDFNVHNWGVELYGDFFFKKTHKGFYIGGLVSLDGYRMKQEKELKGSILGLYLVPRVGYRWVPVPKKVKWLYIQPSFAVPIKVWDDASFFNEDIKLSRAIILPMLTIGMRLNLDEKCAKKME
ncbi:MAG: hypothetical protein GY810_29925 [Aureispira sp.]|nr:hypothetical protein [Aureispira sp.]